MTDDSSKPQRPPIRSDPSSTLRATQVTRSAMHSVRDGTPIPITLRRQPTPSLAFAASEEQITHQGMTGTALAGGGGGARGTTKRARGAELTGRDVELLRYVTRHGVCTGDQLGRKFFAGSTATWRRLRILDDIGLVHRQRTWWQGPRVVLTTRVGAEVARADLPPATLRLEVLEHALSIVDLSEQLLAQHPASTWITERELRRDALRALRADGMETRPSKVRTADGVLVLGERRIAVELDLTAKRTEVYEGLFRAYAAMPGLAGVFWFAKSAQVRGRLSALANRFQLTDFIHVREWTGTMHGPDLALGA